MTQQDATFNYGHSRQVAGREMSTVDAFLEHRSRDRSSDLILKSSEWKKDGKLDLWLHTRSPIAAIWSHSLWRIGELTTDGKKERAVFFTKWNCHDPEEVLKRQYKRRADGSRVTPPEHDPFCKMIEAVRAEVVAGTIRWTDPILKFEGDDRSKTIIVRAGDFWGAFSSKDLSEEEIASMRREGIKKADAWKTALPAKCSYIFVAVDDAHIEAGARILIEGEAIGKKMQKAIRDEMERQGSKELGNPLKNPYLFRWTFDDAKDFADKYDVRVLGKKPSDEVLEIIRDEDPPDTSDQVAPGDIDELRTVVEAHWVADRAVRDRVLQAAFGAKDPAAAPSGEKIEEDRFDCDHCGAKEAMGVEDLECPKCNAAYVILGQGEDAHAVLSSRPCTGCKAQIVLPGISGPGKFGDNVACPQCGAIHHEDNTVDNDGTRVEWFFVQPPKVDPPTVPAKTVEEPKPARRRR